MSQTGQHLTDDVLHLIVEELLAQEEHPHPSAAIIARVNKSLLVPARRRLYSTMFFGAHKEVTALDWVRETLLERPHLATLVRNVIFTIMGNSDQTEEVDSTLLALFKYAQVFESKRSRLTLSQ